MLGEKKKIVQLWHNLTKKVILWKVLKVELVDEKNKNILLLKHTKRIYIREISLELFVVCAKILIMQMCLF